MFRADGVVQARSHSRFGGPMAGIAAAAYVVRTTNNPKVDYRGASCLGRLCLVAGGRTGCRVRIERSEKSKRSIFGPRYYGICGWVPLLWRLSGDFPVPCRLTTADWPRSHCRWSASEGGARLPIARFARFTRFARSPDCVCLPVASSPSRASRPKSSTRLPANVLASTAEPSTRQRPAPSAQATRWSQVQCPRQ